MGRVPTARNPLTRAFSRELRAARTKAGMTQEQLAYESGVHPTYVSQVERGLLSPTLTKLGAMARALGRPEPPAPPRGARSVSWPVSAAGKENT